MAEQVKRKHGDQNSDSDTQYSHKKPGMVACTCNLSTGEMGIETGENWKHAFFFGGGGRHVILKDNTVLCSVCFFSTRPN